MMDYQLLTPNSSEDWSKWTASKTITMAGSHTITAKATDNAGNTKSNAVKINASCIPQDETTRTKIYSAAKNCNSYSTIATGDSDRAGELLTSSSSLVGKSISEVTLV